METTYSFCCRDNMNVTHISARIGVWTYVDWEFYAEASDYYRHLKSVTPLLTSVHYTNKTYFALYGHFCRKAMNVINLFLQLICTCRHLAF